MFSRSILGASALVAVAVAQNLNNNIDNADGLELVPEAVQLGSTFDGTDALGASDEQAPSRISENNFINFCAGETLTNGLQITEGSCNGIPHGQIPAKENMVSSIIINPAPNDVIQSGQTFNIQVQMLNFEPGAFTNAFATYYSAPQFLNEQTGRIIGHTHVTVQDLGGSLAPAQPLDPQQFAFFKGINDAGNGQGLLEAEVDGGLPPGNYRVCTLVSAANHQPVLMPVAQRGSQDDCTKFTVVGDDFDVNDAANNGDGGIDAAAQAQEAVDLGPGAIDPNADAEEADANADDQNAQDAQDAQGQDAQGQDAQGQDAQGQDAQGQDAQGQDAQGQDAQGQGNNAASTLQNLVQNGFGGNGNQAQGNQDNQAQGNQDNQAQGNQDNQAQGNQDNQAQGNQDNQAQGNQDNQAQGNQDNQAQGNQDNQAQDNQAQGNQDNQAQGGNNNNNQSSQGSGGQPTADQLRQQAQQFAQQSQQNKRLARLAKRTFVA